MKCVVCSQPCDGADAVAFECGLHVGHVGCVAAWSKLAWETGRLPYPCPACKGRLLRNLPPEHTIVYIDPQCSHCTKLRNVVGDNGVRTVGFDMVIVNSKHPRVHSPFPHTFVVDKVTHAQHLKPNPVVNMFSRMANIEPDA